MSKLLSLLLARREGWVCSIPSFSLSRLTVCKTWDRWCKEVTLSPRYRLIGSNFPRRSSSSVDLSLAETKTSTGPRTSHTESKPQVRTSPSCQRPRSDYSLVRIYRQETYYNTTGITIYHSHMIP